LEFHRKRDEVIYRVPRDLSESLSKLEEIKKILDSKKKHPFLDDALLTKCNNVFEEATNSIEKQQNYYNEYKNQDPILDRLTQIFDNRVGDGFSQDELEEIVRESKKRFERDVPPGIWTRRSPMRLTESAILLSGRN